MGGIALPSVSTHSFIPAESSSANFCISSGEAVSAFSATGGRLREKPKSRVVLPIEQDGARILHIENREVFSAYLPIPLGPVFMTLIQKAFGEEVTTRTWDTVKKVVASYD